MKLIKILVLASSIAALSACSGYKYDIEEGAAPPPDWANPYAGVYKGRMRVTVKFEGEETTASLNIKSEIDNNGIFTLSPEHKEARASCDGTPPTPINGNSIDWNRSITCHVPEVGAYKTTSEGSYTVSGSVISGTTKSITRCESGIRLRFEAEASMVKI